MTIKTVTKVFNVYEMLNVRNAEKFLLNQKANIEYCFKALTRRFFMMKFPTWLVHWFPRLSSKKAETIRLELEHIFQRRWVLVLNKLRLGELPLPQLQVVFSSRHMAFHKEGVITISSSLISESKEQCCRTIDHEIAHYIQYFMNSRMKEAETPKNIVRYLSELLSAFFGDWSNIYWIIKGRMSEALTEKAFREGFATYVASITSGTLNPAEEKAIKTIQNGKRRKMLLQTRMLPYALGYRTYYAIAKIQSEKQAIQLGLSEHFSKWVSEGGVAFIKLGKPHII